MVKKLGKSENILFHSYSMSYISTDEIRTKQLPVRQYYVTLYNIQPLQDGDGNNTENRMTSLSPPGIPTPRNNRYY